MFASFARPFRSAPAAGERALAPRPRAAEPVIGLALGGGAGRGWAHVGVLRALARAGVPIGVVAGTSIGAVVGGCWAAGKLDALEAFALGLSRRRVLGLMDFALRGNGLIGGARLRRLLAHDLTGVRIEDLKARYAAVATEVGTGHEIWLTRGDLVEAMGASYAIPGIFPPAMVGGRWLMDGVLVNPVPVAAARALGADLVVAVNLHGDVVGSSAVVRDREVPAAGGAAGEAAFEAPRAPGMVGVMVDAFNIAQDRISRSRLAGDPPDVMLCPRLGRIGLLEFHRAEEAIALGKAAAERALEDIAEARAALAERRGG